MVFTFIQIRGCDSLTSSARTLFARPPQHRRGQNCGLYQLAVLSARRVHRSTFCSCNTRPDTDRRSPYPGQACARLAKPPSSRLVSFAWVTRKGPIVSAIDSIGSRWKILKRILKSSFHQSNIIGRMKLRMLYEIIYYISWREGRTDSNRSFFKYHHHHHPRGLSTGL